MIEIKICGLTNVEDARAALAAGADYLGFVLYPKSPRAVTAVQLAAIRRRLPAEARAVGVFVNEPVARVLEVVRECRLWAAQIHGDEAAAAFRALPLPLWRAVAFRDGAWQPDPDGWNASRLVVDAAVPGEYGGTGSTADWQQAADLVRQWTVMLAGGLTSDNVAAAVTLVRPRGVDVSSGVEAAPGRKDHGKITAFVQAVRAAAPRNEQLA